MIIASVLFAPSHIVFEGGWCDEVPEEKEYLVSKTVILTEGSTDARVISEAMKLLYPHMVKFYSFIDFSTYVVQGSTNYLTHYLKAFIAAGIRNRIIGLPFGFLGGGGRMIVS